jgi:sporulation protein YlmC with PRC-barrel domain
MRNKFLILIVLLAISFLPLISADIWVSPADPVINGNGYVFVTYNDSALANTPVRINITNSSGILKQDCNVTLNEYGYGRCKYNFTSTDSSGTWNYSINSSVSGAFEVGKIVINTSIKNGKTSVKYGQKFSVEVNMTYENVMPKEIIPRAMGRDLGTSTGASAFEDIDNDGDKEIIFTDYNGRVWIWENYSRFYNEATMLIAGLDWRTSDIGTYHITNGCIYEDFDGDGNKTIICGDYSGAQLESWVNVDLTAGINVAPTWTGADEGDTIRTAPIACDVDNDSLADQVSINIYDGTTIVYNFNDSTGFTKTYESADLGTGHYGSRGACADFDGDGYNEWMLCSYNTGCYFAEVNHTGDHAVTLGDQQTDYGSYYGYGAAIDFDNDGVIEMVVPNTGGRMEMLEFNKSGTNLVEHDLAYGTDTDIGSFAYGNGGIHFDDLNKNGRPDFIVGDATADAHFYEYDPVGLDWYQLEIYAAAGNSYIRTSYADFDGDGIKEAMTFNRYLGNVYIHRFNGETWEIIYEGYDETFGETSASGDGKKYGVDINSWLYGHECLEGDIDEDGLDEIVCFMYSGRQIIYEQADRVEENVTSNINLNVITNGAGYRAVKETQEEMRILNTGEFLVLKNNIALGITDVVDEDNQNQDSLNPRWTDGIKDGSGFATQDSTEYSDLDGSSTEEAIYSRIKLGENYMVGAVKFWNYYSDGRSALNVIVKSTADSTGDLCNFDVNNTLFDNSADGDNQRYGSGKTGKSVYFSPVNMSCLRESTAGYSGYTTTLGSGNYRTEIEIYETGQVAEIELYTENSSESNYAVKENIEIQITAEDRTGNIISALATNLTIPMTYNELPFNMRIVGGTEYYPGQEGQIVTQLKDEFNDPVTGATCTADYYYPNATLWLDDQATSELTGAGVYYDSFTLPGTDGVYISVVNCTSGSFTDIDSHTFHVSGILISINTTVNSINSTITSTIIPYLSEINSTTHTTYNYLTDTIYPIVNATNFSAVDIKNETAYLVNKWGTYNAEQLYNISNQNNGNITTIITLIGTSADAEGANTLFGEHTYTENRLTEILGNLTDLSTLTSQANTTIHQVNSTITTILTEVDDLEEMHQCTLSPNSSICSLLTSINNDTTNIYSSVQSLSSGSLFQITGLVSGSPKYANENALIEATFAGQNGTAIVPDTINLTIYDPNNNIWDSAVKSDFTQGADNVWKYSNSIGSSPTTGMYTAHLEGNYSNVLNSRVVQFRVATGGPYKVYLDCPATGTMGSELQCDVILQDEGEAVTESTSTIWIDTDNDGVADAGEPQASFSKQTVSGENVTQSVSISIPSSHATGLYVVRVDTSYANSAQPNSGASDSVTLGNAAAEETSSGPSSPSGGGSITGKVIYNLEEEEIEEGTTQSLADGEKVKFEIIKEGFVYSHSLEIIDLQTDRATITIFSPPITFILYTGEEKAIDLDNDGSPDLKVKLEKIENNRADINIKTIYSTIEGEGETSEDEQNISGTGTGSPGTINFSISKSFIWKIIGILAAITIIVLSIMVFSNHRKKNSKIERLESRIKHLKSLESTGKMSYSSYHLEKERLLKKIARMLKNKHLIFILSTMGILAIFTLGPKPNITGQAISAGGSSPGGLKGLFVLGILTVLLLGGIIFFLLYLLKEIRSMKESLGTRKENSKDSAKRTDLEEEKEETILPMDGEKTQTIINIDSTKISGLISKRVVTDSGHYMGEVKEVLLDKNKINGFKIELDKKQKFKTKGIIIKFSNVKSIGHVMVVDKRILEKIIPEKV